MKRRNFVLDRASKRRVVGEEVLAAWMFKTIGIKRRLRDGRDRDCQELVQFMAKSEIKMESFLSMDGFQHGEDRFRFLFDPRGGGEMFVQVGEVSNPGPV